MESGSKGALRWLTRLDRPRSIESLISEVYGEAAMLGCLFEREVADLLTFFDLARNFVESVTRPLFDTDDWTLNALTKEIRKRAFLKAEQLSVLDDGREARNELIHRWVGTQIVVSQADKELLLSKIDHLYSRIWRAHQLAEGLKRYYATKAGITDERITEIVKIPGASSGAFEKTTSS